MIRILILAAAACAALLAVAATGSARSGSGSGDRNHDRIPDRWERAYHLSLKVNQARRDQDHDGLRNRAEFLAGTNPRSDDSDDDGTDDGDEGAGTVTSFTGGVLVIRLFNGDDVKGTVNDQTEIECESRPTGATVVPTARKADDGPGDDDDQGDDDHRGPGGGGDDGDDDEHGDDDNEQGCDATALTTGAVVHEAELKTTAAGLVFKEIEIVS